MSRLGNNRGAAGDLATRPVATDKARYGVLAAATVGIMLGSSTIIYTTFGIFAAPLQKLAGWSHGEVSLAFALYTWGVAAMAPVGGLLIDRFGVRRILIPSLIFFYIAFAALGLVGDRLWQFYLTYLLIALITAPAVAGAYTKVLIGWFDASRGMALGVALAGVGLGGVIFPPLALWLMSSVGIALTYPAIAGGVALITLPLVLALLRERRAAAPSSGNPRLAAVTDAPDPLLQIVSSRNFITLGIAFILLGVFTGSILAHLVPLLMDRGVPQARAVATMSLLSGALAVGRLGAGWMLDRVHAPYVIAAFLAGPVVGSSLLAAGAGSDAALVCAVLLGIGIGAEFDFMSYLVSRYLPERSYGRSYASIYSIYMIGSGVGPLALGLSVDRLGNYTFGLAVVAVVTAAAIPVLLSLGDHRSRAATPTASPEIA